MYNDPAAWDRINSFALVSYIPEPLAGFLDELRQELVPNCFLRAHVTILPPRPISSSPEAAWETVRTLAPLFPPFEVEMTQVEVFPVSDVIYIGIGRGPRRAAEHARRASTSRASCVTSRILIIRTSRWRRSSKVTKWTSSPASPAPAGPNARLPKNFRVDKVVFVQNTRRN